MTTGNVEPGAGDDGERDSEEVIRNKRQIFFDSLLAAVKENHSECAARGTFATSGSIDHCLLGSLGVEGAGVLRLPLNSIDAAKLRRVSEQAPHGQGVNTVVDTAVRRASQVDASKVSFPNDPHFLTRIHELAATAVKQLEGDNQMLQAVEARLYKLLFYETGGHFKVHRDTEKEPGMFATLIVQLPTEGGFEGGALVVNHRTGTLVFENSRRTSTGFSYTSFFADCEHTLEPVKAGTRLCLSFNLVRRNCNGGNVEHVGREVLSSPMLKKVEDVLRPWLKAIEEDDAVKSTRKDLGFFPSKLAIPLQHKYTRANLSFSGLKGEDVTLFHALASCLGRRLDLHLCLLTRHEMGTPFVQNGPCRKYRKAWTGEEGEHLKIDDIFDETVQASHWVDLGNERLRIFPRHLDTETEVVLGKHEEGPFLKGADPDELQYEGYMGNEGPTVEYFYHKAMVVVWPKPKTVPIIIAQRRPNDITFAATVPEDAEVLSLLNMVERLQKEGDPLAHVVLDQLLAHCERKYEGIWQKHDQPLLDDDLYDDLEDLESRANRVLEQFGCTVKAKCVSSRLLDMCLVAGDLAAVLRVLKLYSKTFQVQKHDSNHYPSHTVPWYIGLRSKFVSKSIAAAVHAHGWTACGDVVLQFLQKDRVLSEGEYYGQLAVELLELGHNRESFLIAKEALKLVTSSMKSTQCSPELFKTLVKLMMSKVGLEALGPQFLQWLGPKPEFSWIQPFADLPYYPSIEAFLKGPKESFTYHDVIGLPGARELARSFDGQLRDGYCATGREGGRGAGAYCVITKSRAGFQLVLQNWHQRLEETSELRHLLQECSDEPGANKKRGRSDGTEATGTQVEEGEKKPRGPGGSSSHEV